MRRTTLITIGVPTFNRLDILRKMAKSLYLSLDEEEYHIRVYDDCSTELSYELLHEVFPDAEIYRHSENHGPDYNMYYMYKDFLKSDDEFFFNADSDLIFSREWTQVGLKKIEYTDGVLSLFNTKNHVGKPNGNGFLLKDDIGAAGTLFKRDIIERIVDFFRNQEENVYKGFDWQWNEFLVRQGIHLYTLENSYVQHIGYDGLHSSKCSYDYGENFIVDTLYNGQVINDLFLEFIDAQTTECRRKCFEYNVGVSVLKPLRFIKHTVLGK